MPILTQYINGFCNKLQYEKALFIAKEFKLKTPEVQKAAFKQFGVKLKGSYYRDAVKLVKEFKLPKEAVQKNVLHLLEILETKKEEKKVEALKSAFGLHKKGMISELFGV